MYIMAKKIEVNQEVLEIQERMESVIEEIQEIEQGKAQLEALYKEKIEKIKLQYEAKAKAMNEIISFKKNELRGLFDQVPHKATKTQEKVTLLAGDVVLKKAATKLDYDKNVLLAAAQEKRELYLSLTKQLEEAEASIEAGEGGEAIIDLRSNLEKQIQENDFTMIQYIKTTQKEEFDWSGYKESICITEDGAIINKLTGEVLEVEGLKVTETQEELSIK